MLSIIRSNNPIVVIILLIYLILLKVYALLGATVPTVLDSQVTFGAIVHMLEYVMQGGAYGYMILSILFTFVQAVYLNAVVIKHKLLGKSTYIPAFLFITFASLHPSFSTFSAVLLANWFVIAAVDLLLTMHQTNNPRQVIFNTGFCLGMVAILHSPAVILFLVMFVTLSLMRHFNIAEWTVAFLGYLTPIYFLASILFLLDKEGLLLNLFDFGISLPRSLDKPLYFLGVVIGVLILLILGTYMIQGQINKVGVFVRRSWSVMAILLFAAALSAVFTSYDIAAAWLIMAVPMSLIVAPALNNEKTKGFSNFVFYLSLLLGIFAQLAANY